MHRATAIAAIAAVGMIALADNASAFHGKSVRYVVYPSYCSPYTYLYYPVRVKSHTPCWYKHQMKAAYRYGCYPGTGCCARPSNAVWGGCYAGCGGYAGCTDGCGSGCYGGGCYDGGCGNGSCGNGGCGTGNCGGGDCGLGGCDGGCATGGCSTGGCATGGCGTGGGAGCNGDGGSAAIDGSETQGEVIYDGPAAGKPATEPAPADPVPAEDSSASTGQSPFRLTASTRRDATQPAAGSAAFERGVRMMRDGQTTQSLEAFHEASSAEPSNAMYLYHQAMALYDTQGAEAAQSTLEQAIEAERQAPVPNWGKRMERVQGRTRLWIEKARRDAGLTR